MTPTLLLLDSAPLRDLAQGRASNNAVAHSVHAAWLRDRCVFSPLSLLIDHDRGIDTPHVLRNTERLRETLLGMGMLEIGPSWETLRESSRFQDLAPFSHPWFLAGIALHLDATLVTDCPLLLQPLSPPLRTLAWTSDPMALAGDHAAL